MRRYAVVGGIGAGKSTVCRMLARHGGRVVDVDRLGHQALRLQRVRQQLSARFGAAILGRDGGIDRRALGRRVFGDAAALGALNAIVHPEIGRLLRQHLARLEAQGVPYVLIDAALFLDVDLGVRVDAVLAVTAPRALRRLRLRRRDDLSPAECEARLASQRRVGVWTRQADFRIDTRGTRAALAQRLDVLWRELQRTGQKRGGQGWR